MKRYMTEVFGADLPAHRPHGLLSVEHSGRPAHSNDGLCLTLLVSVRIPIEDVCKGFDIRTYYLLHQNCSIKLRSHINYFKT